MHISKFTKITIGVMPQIKDFLTVAQKMRPKQSWRSYVWRIKFGEDFI